jgi:hypothetical protein
MRAHNVLYNSYNSRDKPLQLSSCTFCVFTRISCALLTCDMYMSDLRHIHDPVLSSLKMEGIRLLSSLKMEVTESYETSVTTHQMPTVARDSNKIYTFQYNQNNGKVFGFFLINRDLVKIGTTPCRNSIVRCCEK